MAGKSRPKGGISQQILLGGDRWPTHEALVFYSSNLQEKDVLTYEELRQCVLSFSQILQIEGVNRGDRVSLLMAPGLEFPIAFLAVVYLGAVAVPIPSESTQFKSAVAALNAMEQFYADSESKLLVLDKKSMGLADSCQRSGMSTLVMLSVRELLTIGGSGVFCDEVAADDICFLQYTSGSTTAPKGVILSHANLHHNIACIQGKLNVGPGTALVSWLPQFHVRPSTIGAFVADRSTQ